MRLWHIDLIPMLPRQQLVAQWRELSAIAGSIKQKGIPNHILVNFVTEYSWNHFISYAFYVRQEMTKRGYRTMNSVWEKICSVANGDYNIIPIEEVYHKKMIGEHYYTTCLWNLIEKVECGGITEEPYCDLIVKEFNKKVLGTD